MKRWGLSALISTTLSVTVDGYTDLLPPQLESGMGAKADGYLGRLLRPDFFISFAGPWRKNSRLNMRESGRQCSVICAMAVVNGWITNPSS
jgi:hypothetical protein